MQYPPSADRARISEIFSSLQGEGTHLGERHLFIRFEECHIQCTYCDEVKTGVEMTLDQVIEEVKRLEALEGPHAFVSLTGGEPLLYLVFLRSLLPALKNLELKVYLETNGILWQALEDVIGWCDVIAMDMKPASVTGDKNYDSDHRRFLQTAVQKEVFVKMVLSKEIFFTEYENEIRIIADIDPRIPVILQPISSRIEGHDDPELMELLGRLQRNGSQWASNIRIVPRFHKIFNLR
ncbi:MAG: 7-carboxy-7-deazaguanine synthase QueE [Candidatus Omnitrophica bacterium]|nr:7-carboxy-7-deazaguanine synthase QueE [Candidatus Omnitrophota bacterium]